MISETPVCILSPVSLCLKHTHKRNENRCFPQSLAVWNIYIKFVCCRPANHWTLNRNSCAMIMRDESVT